MAERKVINKYYPPDFDPSKIPRRHRPKEEQHKVRLMAPFSMRCNTCGEWIAKGKKFNARKEDAVGEKYLTIQIYRFYIRCPRCSAEITFKTDPEHTDYTCEHGAQRNFEPWRDDAEATEGAKLEQELEEENNPMKSLENRALESRREIEALDALDELRSMNARHERMARDGIALDHLFKDEEEDGDGEVDEDEKLVRSIFGEDSSVIVRRLSDGEDDNGSDEDEDEGGVQYTIDHAGAGQRTAAATKRDVSQTPTAVQANRQGSAGGTGQTTKPVTVIARPGTTAVRGQNGAKQPAAEPSLPGLAAAASLTSTVSARPAPGVSVRPTLERPAAAPTHGSGEKRANEGSVATGSSTTITGAAARPAEVKRPKLTASALGIVVKKKTSA